MKTLVAVRIAFREHTDRSFINFLDFDSNSDNDENTIPLSERDSSSYLYQVNTESSQSSVVDENKSFFYSQKKGFEDIGANSKTIEVLKSLGVLRPSKIQSLSFKTVLEGKTCIIAGNSCRYFKGYYALLRMQTDQTGSGKTLSYLAPCLQNMMDFINVRHFVSQKNFNILEISVFRTSDRKELQQLRAGLPTWSLWLQLRSLQCTNQTVVMKIGKLKYESL